MKILILTPDTDIDRRIILQANSLINKGFEVTIIGVPHSGENYLSGSVNDRIKIKRVDLSDLEYHSTIVKLYKKFHKKVMNFAYKRNDFLNSYANKNTTFIDDQSSHKTLKKIKNKLVAINTKVMNYVSTKIIGIAQKAINLFYNAVLFFFRTFNINFFPIFDKAFYKAGIQEEADVIVANDLPSLKAGYMLAAEKNVPLIYDAHENYTEQCTLPKGYATILERIEAQILPKVSFWIVPNELLGEQIIEKCRTKYNTEVEQPLVIQNAVKQWTEYADFIRGNIIKDKLGLESNKKVLLFQGGFLAKRNLENLVKSFKYVKNENVVLVMLGFGTYVEVLKSLAMRWKLNGRVFFMDAVSQDELLKYTCSADAGVIPYPAVDKNTYYCSPNKLYEFIQARLPILANDLPFLRKVIVGRGIGLVQDFSKPKLIAAAVDQFFSDENRLYRFKENLEVASAEVSWEIEEEKLTGEYENKLRGIKVKTEVLA